MTDPDEYEFDVAVSFAGEDRELVSEVVDGIKGQMKVFYDEDYLVEAWGEDGVEYFSNVYLKRARFTVVFVSHHYAQKMWTRLERRSALARAATERSAYLLPVRLDDTQLEGLLPSVIYLDSRRLGTEGIVQAIKSKVSRSLAMASPAIESEGKVPRSQAEIEALITERTGHWEFLLYAGLLRVSMDKLEPKYRDFSMGYARRNGRYASRQDLVSYAQQSISDISGIVGNFNLVFDADAQERAFGAPGQPGDVDRIIHLADRFISIYEDFMDWASDLRGTATPAGSDLMRALARWAEQPVAECRRFVIALCAELDELPERIRLGEPARIELAITLELDPEITKEVEDKLRAAIEE